ncbi:hypothetical protein BV25DRAFT_1279527 [Artomyces pyxidatus]|uniref:Uncharacterized protein n=1 Tax=Artomyces pyxidatus TaxID=48021 RepID=A0ACB8TFF8_9AGAM|nr:hypothetical protein BV25DRAFT_1279527 [Artomyces pyxidatus]
MPSKHKAGKKHRQTNKAIVDLTVDALSRSTVLKLPEFWAEAQQRLGVEKAGATLEDFIKMNTKAIKLDPWAEASADLREGKNVAVRTSGSDDPLTFECLVPFFELAATTKPPSFIDPMIGIVLPVNNSSAIIRRGEWVYVGIPATPAEGLQLEDWEIVRTMAARFTMPFSKAEVKEIN